jgi:outer membrane receptor protein involved in Fe transport
MRTIHFLLAATALAGVSPALAQTSTTAPATPPDSAAANATATIAAPADSELIVVTGSRIPVRPNLASPVPVTSVLGTEFFQTGKISIGDILNELPSLQSTFTSANSTRFLGTGGLNLLDLRGLGTQRTLVLVNGRRHVGSDILNNAVSPDTNTFPTDLIERVDVVTGGDSAVYGSDAIAGVVNFVLKDHFQGLEVRGQGGTNVEGNGGSYYASVLAGTNFAQDRGNVAVNVEYAQQQDFFASQTQHFNQQDVFITTHVAGSDDTTTPNNLFFQNIRSAGYGNGGLVRFQTGQCGQDYRGKNFRCTYLFQPDGTLIPETGTRVGLAPAGSFIGGNGINFREGNQLGLQPALDRYAINLIGHFEVSPAFVPFVEAKFVRTDSLGSASGPAFINGGTLGDPREQPRLDNPYLSQQAHDLIVSQLVAANNFGGGHNTAADYPGDFQFSLRENLLGLGSRQESARRDTYRIVAGVRGKFQNDWNYEVSANYGDFTEATKVLGNLNTQRFLLAIDSVRDPGGNIVCRSRIDPTAANGLGGLTALPGQTADQALAAQAAVLATDVTACQPLNPFGVGNISAAARNYVIQDTISRGRITQFVASGSLSGDSNRYFRLPGGPIGFSIGAEYRRETNKFSEDPLVQQGYTFYNIIPSFSPPAFEVAEGFGELRIPILKDRPFFKDLTVSGAGRVSGYKGSAGIVYAYNGAVEYSPVSDIRFRGNYSRSVRAPNLVDLYQPQGQNFATVVDPCSSDNIHTGSNTRVANCAAAGIPTTYNFQYSQSLQIVSGGNPGLRAEKSDSYTYGVVLRPHWIQGLSATADYYNIIVNDVITAPSAQQIINACYDLGTLNNQFCGLFQRFQGVGPGPHGEITGQIVEGSLQQLSLNYAKYQARGIDAEVAYARTLADTKLGFRFQYTHQFQNDYFLDPTDPGRISRNLSTLSYPEDKFNINLDVKHGSIAFGYKLRYIGEQLTSAYEDFYSVQGRPAQNPYYSNIRNYPAITYHDIRLAIDVDKKTSFYFGVDNVINQNPPLGLTGIGGGSGIYDNRGRFFYAGFKLGLK